MKNYFLLLSILLGTFLVGCTEKQKEPDTDEDVSSPIEQPIDINELNYELLMHLEFIPHEVGTSMTLIQDEKLYQSWAEIFHFDETPVIDFATEEVLFVTEYSNGCGLVFDTLTQKEDTLHVKLNFPEEIRTQKSIACNDIAMPNSYVIKLKKTNATKGTLEDPYAIRLENVNIEI
ncbi:dehydrogenase [Solibacillus daqui]|uniref:dehydrogenase n=1 Tax=Solibacillus daqui TaxID=2912187 RepID=UPI002365425B|nr:dehydrogenase [Solibacillus daqui]